MDSTLKPEGEPPALPRVSIVFLVFNRREELAESLHRMVEDDDYPADRIEVVVVDNASHDGSAAMVRQAFPSVTVVERATNCGVSGWNDGFAVATGEWVLALDDDCYLPRGGLRRAVNAADEHRAELVSFSVRSLQDPDHIFTEAYRTGLLAFWGCAVLVRRTVLDDLVGYDPEIFVWANELELMLRFFDARHRHLHLPEVTAVHMKPADEGPWTDYIKHRSHQINARHWGYIAAKLLRPRDSVAALVALLATYLREGARIDRAALGALRPTVAGYVHGLRYRRPVAPAVSTTYRQGFHTFASPWWFSSPLTEIVRTAPLRLARTAAGRPVKPRRSRKGEYFARQARFYPTTATSLQLLPPEET